MDLGLEDKVAVITGGASGIGRATVEAFAAEGARVVIADRDEAAGQAVAAAAEDGGAEALFVATDVQSGASVDALFDSVLARWGRIDCAFNNAGIACRNALVGEAEEDDFDRVMDINVKGVWRCLRRECAEMVKTGGGAIVNTASVAGLVGWRTAASYTASKHAVIGLTRSAALDYARRGIRVNAICPGVIDTPMGAPATRTEGKVHDALLARHPVARFGEPGEVARAVVWLCSSAASFTTGHAMTVDGGFVVP